MRDWAPVRNIFEFLNRVAGSADMPVRHSKVHFAIPEIWTFAVQYREVIDGGVKVSNFECEVSVI